MDIRRIQQKYRRNARFYDLVEWPFRILRAAAIDELQLRPGDVVLDLGNSVSVNGVNSSGFASVCRARTAPS